MSRTPGRATDPRVVRTRALLQSTLLTMASEQTLESLSVADVAAKAGVNRATFYAHYPDLNALLVDALSEELGEFIQRTAQSFDEGQPMQAQVRAGMHVMFDMVDARRPLYQFCLGPHGSGPLWWTLHETIAATIQTKSEAQRRFSNPSIPIEIRASMCAGALVGGLSTWLAAPQQTGREVYVNSMQTLLDLLLWGELPEQAASLVQLKSKSAKKGKTTKKEKRLICTECGWPKA
jgi:AcrR family transcriptional regulator